MIESELNHTPKLVLRQGLILLFWSFILSLWFIFIPIYVPFTTPIVAYASFFDGLSWGQGLRKYMFIVGSIVVFGVFSTGVTKLFCLLISSNDQLQDILSGLLIFCPARDKYEHIITTIFYAVALLLTIRGEKGEVSAERLRKEKIKFYALSFFILVLPIILTLTKATDWSSYPW